MVFGPPKEKSALRDLKLLWVWGERRKFLMSNIVETTLLMLLKHLRLGLGCGCEFSLCFERSDYQAWNLFWMVDLRWRRIILWRRRREKTGAWGKRGTEVDSDREEVWPLTVKKAKSLSRGKADLERKGTRESPWKGGKRRPKPYFPAMTGQGQSKRG